MKRPLHWATSGLTVLALAALWTAWRFDSDIKAASAMAAQGSVMITTRCGPIEYQEAGAGTPLLMIHGSGGGHDQGMAFAGNLAQQGVRVIAMSRFGYLRTPMPAGLHVTRNQVIKYVLATPPAQVSNASPQERARINAMMDRILPVSARAAGLRSDSVLGKSLGPSALGSVRAPTLIVSVRDDGFGTYASAQYTASQIKGAKFVGFEHGGHVWVGHQDEVMAEVANLLNRVGQ